MLRLEDDMLEGLGTHYEQSCVVAESSESIQEVYVLNVNSMAAHAIYTVQNVDAAAEQSHRVQGKQLHGEHVPSDSLLSCACKLEVPDAGLAVRRLY